MKYNKRIKVWIMQRSKLLNLYSWLFYIILIPVVFFSFHYVFKSLSFLFGLLGFNNGAILNYGDDNADYAALFVVTTAITTYYFYKLRDFVHNNTANSLSDHELESLIEDLHIDDDLSQSFIKSMENKNKTITEVFSINKDTDYETYSEIINNHTLKKCGSDRYSIAEIAKLIKTDEKLKEIKSNQNKQDQKVD